MGNKTFRPFTPSLRWTAISDFAELSPKHKKPEKALMENLRRSGGRNSRGRMTSRRRGGGHKRNYRIIDFKRDKVGVEGKVVSVEYDPNRTARIALVEYTDKEKRYILAPVGLTVGMTVSSGPGAEIQPGCALPIRSIPLGAQIHNLELRLNGGGQMVRTAGGYAILMAKEGNFAQVRLPSGEIRLIHLDCYASVGQIGNIDHENISLGKAGRHRWMGRRPASRAVVKNPVDHPMGGGEGKSSGGRHPCSRGGQLAKGYKTRTKKKPSSKYIVTGRPR
ncbi:MAG: 50S ribosomal protein L2 [Candidatus Omnitrophica bacterium CG07_land_8_20_14_0_80_50_8]|nr:MAG: 50S ribosomal protein L2 [Candidatus Omnitrophica bacterium CG1_02_49_16]PIU40178.1 MAG: 50S ribosomal protein L2 [Candidatus Omnitrophica bacterium CG07_land_8_20_14_0_80_50_8]